MNNSKRVWTRSKAVDVRAEWAFPLPTHSKEALQYDKWGTGEYWDRHEVRSADRPLAPTGIVENIRITYAFLDRSMANCEGYAGHTGSPLDEPAKTLKAGDHGVPGGENMIAFPDGRLRYFTVREAARIQTFPDDYVFGSSWSENMRQLGNAVPVSLGRVVASAMRRGLSR